MNKNNLSLIFVLMILLIILSMVISLFYSRSNSSQPKQTEQLNLRQSFENEGFKNTGKVEAGNCNDQTPACGYCPGIIIEGYCYIKP